MKPCPFCGSTEINHHYPDEHGHHVCWCGNCGAFGPNDVSEVRAREMWNLRRPTADLLAACELALQYAQDYMPNLTDDDGWKQHQSLVDAIDAAIARARGEETSPPQPIEPEMIHIPAGEFLMGSDPNQDNDAYEDEQPQYSVSLPDYHIAKIPVTNAQYAPFVEATGHRVPKHWNGEKPPENKQDHPVVNVSWHDVTAYCKWLAETTNKDYRLPSEAEWEKAARGTDGRIYPWGDEPPDESRCNFDDNVEDTTPVGQYSPIGDSPYGCVDMAGNAWEWCHSLYKSFPYDTRDGREDPDAEGDRVLRGGAFSIDEWYVRCADRLRSDPYSRGRLGGFRVVLAPGL